MRLSIREATAMVVSDRVHLSRASVKNSRLSGAALLLLDSKARNTMLLPRSRRSGRCRARGTIAAALFVLGSAGEVAAAGNLRAADRKPQPGAWSALWDDLYRLQELRERRVLVTDRDNNRIVSWIIAAARPDLVQGPFARTCDGPLDIQFYPPSGSTFPVGMTTVTCSRSNEVALHEITSEGSLDLRSLTPSGGIDPAHLTVSVDGNYTLVTNRASKNVTAFRLDPESGTLSPIGSVPVAGSPGPVEFDPTGSFAVVGTTDPNALVTLRFSPSTNELGVVRSDSVPGPVSALAYADHQVVPTGLNPGPSPESTRNAAEREQLLYVGVRGQPQMGIQDRILTYRVGPAGELTPAGSINAGIFLTDIEVSYDRLFAVTANTMNRDEIRAYRRVGTQLVLDASLEIPEPSVSFKQIAVAPSEGRVTTLVVTGYQGGWIRSFEYTRDDDPRCTSASEIYCANGNRFEVSVDWAVPSQNRSGSGIAVPITSDTGYFWFFSANNVELVVKVVDGRAFNNFFWVFYGALSDVAYTITVTDTATGRVRRYTNTQGRLASAADVTAFPGGAVSKGGAPSPGTEKAVADLERKQSSEVASLLASAASKFAREECSEAAPSVLSATSPHSSAVAFQVRIDWRVPSQGTSGVGQGVLLTPDTAYFWFFSPNNVEVTLKVVDGRVVNGHYWVFFGALSDVEYTVRVTNTDTGAVRTYFNPSGTIASVADVTAF